MAAGTKPWLAFYGIFPALLFCFLDTYYLWLERGFRRVYNAVRTGEGTELFVMSPVKYLNPDQNPEDDLLDCVCLQKGILGAFRGAPRHCDRRLVW